MGFQPFLIVSFVVGHLVHLLIVSVVAGQAGTGVVTASAATHDAIEAAQASVEYQVPNGVEDEEDEEKHDCRLDNQFDQTDALTKDSHIQAHG